MYNDEDGHSTRSYSHSSHGHTRNPNFSHNHNHNHNNYPSGSSYHHDDSDYEYVDDIQSMPLPGGTGADAEYLDVYPRPSMTRRESQDVEFSHRSALGGPSSHSHAWEVNVKLPKGLRLSRSSHTKTKAKAKEKAKALIQGLRRSHSLSAGKAAQPPPIEFRDSQPVPASVRQQYAELAPLEGNPAAVAALGLGGSGIRTSEDGKLAPPLTATASTASSTTPPVSLLDVELRNRDRDRDRRRSRVPSNSALMSIPTPTRQSQSQRSPSTSALGLPAPSLHRRSRSAESAMAHMNLNGNLDAGVDGDGEDTLVGHGTQLTHGETTLAHQDAVRAPSTSGSWYNHLPRLPSSKSGGSDTLSSLGTVKGDDRSRRDTRRHSVNSKSSRYSYRVPSQDDSEDEAEGEDEGYNLPNVRTSPHPLHTVLDPVVRMVRRLQRLPWVADTPVPRGWIVPYNDPPRIAADFVPKRDSARSRLRAKAITDGHEGSGALTARDVNANGVNASWYHPRAPTTGIGLGMGVVGKEIKNLWKAGVSTNMAVASAYQDYLEGVKKNRKGRPVGYMYRKGSGGKSAYGDGEVNGSAYGGGDGSPHSMMGQVPGAYGPPSPSTAMVARSTHSMRSSRMSGMSAGMGMPMGGPNAPGMHTRSASMSAMPGGGGAGSRHGSNYYGYSNPNSPGYGTSNGFGNGYDYAQQQQQTQTQMAQPFLTRQASTSRGLQDTNTNTNGMGMGNGGHRSNYSSSNYSTSSYPSPPPPVPPKEAMPGGYYNYYAQQQQQLQQQQRAPPPGAMYIAPSTSTDSALSARSAGGGAGVGTGPRSIGSIPSYASYGAGARSGNYITGSGGGYGASVSSYTSGGGYGQQGQGMGQGQGQGQGMGAGMGYYTPSVGASTGVGGPVIPNVSGGGGFGGPPGPPSSYPGVGGPANGVVNGDNGTSGVLGVGGVPVPVKYVPYTYSYA